MHTSGPLAYHTIEGMNDLATMMQALEHEFKPSRKAIQSTALQVFRQLDGLRCTSSRNVEEYAAEFKRLLEELSDLGLTMSQHPLFAVTTFLIHLGPSFDHFCNFFENVYSPILKPGRQVVDLDDTTRLAIADQQARRQNGAR